MKSKEGILREFMEEFKTRLQRWGSPPADAELLVEYGEVDLKPHSDGMMIEIKDQRNPNLITDIHYDNSERHAWIQIWDRRASGATIAEAEIYGVNEMRVFGAKMKFIADFGVLGRKTLTVSRWGSFWLKDTVGKRAIGSQKIKRETVVGEE